MSIPACNPDKSWTLVKYLRDATYDLIPLRWVRKRHGEECHRAWFPVNGTVKGDEYCHLKETCAKPPSSHPAEWLKATVTVRQAITDYGAGLSLLKERLDAPSSSGATKEDARRPCRVRSRPMRLAEDDGTSESSMSGPSSSSDSASDAEEVDGTQSKIKRCEPRTRQRMPQKIKRKGKQPVYKAPPKNASDAHLAELDTESFPKPTSLEGAPTVKLSSVLSKPRPTNSKSNLTSTDSVSGVEDCLLSDSELPENMEENIRDKDFYAADVSNVGSDGQHGDSPVDKSGPVNMKESSSVTDLLNVVIDKFDNFKKEVVNRLTSLESMVAALTPDTVSAGYTSISETGDGDSAEEGLQEEEETPIKVPAETQEEFLINDKRLADPQIRRVVRKKLLKGCERVPSGGFLRMALFKLIAHKVVEELTWGGGNGTIGVKESYHHLLMEEAVGMHRASRKLRPTLNSKLASLIKTAAITKGGSKFEYRKQRSLEAMRKKRKESKEQAQAQTEICMDTDNSE